jgi:hypothetical protein
LHVIPKAKKMNVKLIFNIVLALLIVGLVYYLYKIIQEPIVFEAQKKIRYNETVVRLKNIRTAQLAYKELHGKFAKDFNILVNSLKNDTYPEVKIVGNPDDTTQVITYDTTLVPLKERAFKDAPFNLDSIAFIPYSGGVKFNLDAGEVVKNNIKVQVFEASAEEKVFLKELKEEFDKYIDDKAILSVGSMSEGTLSGNWE